MKFAVEPHLFGTAAMPTVLTTASRAGPSASVLLEEGHHDKSGGPMQCAGVSLGRRLYRRLILESLEPGWKIGDLPPFKLPVALNFLPEHGEANCATPGTLSRQ